jgi:hypothetical protein
MGQAVEAEQGNAAGEPAGAEDGTADRGKGIEGLAHAA